MVLCLCDLCFCFSSKYIRNFSFVHNDVHSLFKHNKHVANEAISSAKKKHKKFSLEFKEPLPTTDDAAAAEVCASASLFCRPKFMILPLVTMWTHLIEWFQSFAFPQRHLNKLCKQIGSQQIPRYARFRTEYNGITVHQHWMLF